MNFKNISELREFIRRYNSTSILKVGANKCWHNWENWNTKYSNSLDWLKGNTKRNYIIRIMLLASSSNPYRHGDISIKEFDRLIEAYQNLEHTISDKHILDSEAKILLDSIQNWESSNDNKRKLRNFSLRLSDILSIQLIRSYTSCLFSQRMVAFQNSSFGYSFGRIQRTIKFVRILDKILKVDFSGDFPLNINLNLEQYFRLFFTCLGMFTRNFSNTNANGFCDIYKLPYIDEHLQELGISLDNVKMFIKHNSMTFTSKSEEGNSFCNNIDQILSSIPSFYQPFLYNLFLASPMIDLNNGKFCLPDPISFMDSCWNQVGDIISQNGNEKKLQNLLGNVFEKYIESTFLPCIAPHSFKRINEVENPDSKQDKRADFLIETSNAYIVLECKASIMSAETSAYCQPDQLAASFYRIHSAVEQISRTIADPALKLNDKPVIPLILTFYDSIAAALTFQEMLKETDYCSRMRLNMIPIIHSLHEFEHWISDRSLDNWVELILSKHNAIAPVPPDNKGHNYRHLEDITINFG